MGLKREEIKLVMFDGTEQTFKIKELSWYDHSVLSDEGWTSVRYQELCIEEPKMTPEIWSNIPRKEGRKLFDAITNLNIEKGDETKKV